MQVSIPYGKWNLQYGNQCLCSRSVSIPYGKWNLYNNTGGNCDEQEVSIPYGKWNHNGQSPNNIGGTNVSIPYGKWNPAENQIKFHLLLVSIPYGKWNRSRNDSLNGIHLFQYPMGNGTLIAIIIIGTILVSIPYGKWNQALRTEVSHRPRFNTLWEMEPCLLQRGLACALWFQYPMGNGTVKTLFALLQYIEFQYPMGNGTSYREMSWNLNA